MPADPVAVVGFSLAVFLIRWSSPTMTSVVGDFAPVPQMLFQTLTI